MALDRDRGTTDDASKNTARPELARLLADKQFVKPGQTGQDENDRTMRTLGFNAADAVVDLLALAQRNKGKEEPAHRQNDEPNGAPKDQPEKKPQLEDPAKKLKGEADRLVSVIARDHGVEKLSGLVGVDPRTNQDGVTATRSVKDTDGKPILVTATHKPNTIVVQKGEDVYAINLQNPGLNLKFSPREGGQITVTGSTPAGKDAEMRLHVQQAARGLTEQGEKELVLGHKERGEQLFKAAVSIATGGTQQKLGGTTELLSAQTFGQIARAYRDSGDPKSALPFMQQTVASYEKLGDPGEIMYERRTLASLYRELGDSPKALKEADRVAQDLLAYERTNGKNNHTAVEERKELASLYSKLGETGKAIALLDRSVDNLQEQEKIKGKDDPDNINERDRLAISFSDVRRKAATGATEDNLRQRSKALLDESAAVMTDMVEKHGPSDATALRMREDLKHLYQEALGDGGITPIRALDRPFLEKTLPADEKKLGEGNPQVMADRSRLAVIYSFANKPEEAAALLNKSLTVVAKQPGKGTDHPDNLPILDELAWVYHRAKDWPHAKDALQRQLALQEKLKDPGAETTKRYLEETEAELRKRKSSD